MENRGHAHDLGHATLRSPGRIDSTSLGFAHLAVIARAIDRKQRKRISRVEIEGMSRYKISQCVSPVLCARRKVA